MLHQTIVGDIIVFIVKAVHIICPEFATTKPNETCTKPMNLRKHYNLRMDVIATTLIGWFGYNIWYNTYTHRLYLRCKIVYCKMVYNPNVI